MDRPLETSGRCPLCGEPLREPDRCSNCDWVRGYRQQQERVRRQHHPRDTVAAAMSIVPGAGHIFKGYTLAGWLILLAVPILCVFAFAFTMFFGWLLLPAYWIAVGVDAYLRKDLRLPSAVGGVGS